MKITYNKRSDVLYVILSETANHCSYAERPVGIITRIDDLTHKIVGVTVYDFMKKVNAGERMTIPGVDNDLCGASLAAAVHPDTVTSSAH